MKKLIFHEPKNITLCDNIKLLRVELSGNYTKIDFGYEPPEDNEIVGKVRISKGTYLLVGFETKKYILTRAVNIPIAPKYHHFKTTTDWLFYSLYFEPVPVKCSVIHLTEKEGLFGNFDFCAIELEVKKQFEVK